MKLIITYHDYNHGTDSIEITSRIVEVNSPELEEALAPRKYGSIFLSHEVEGQFQRASRIIKSVMAGVCSVCGHGVAQHEWEDRENSACIAIHNGTRCLCSGFEQTAERAGKGDGRKN